LLRNAITVDDFIGTSLRDAARNLNAKGIAFECVGNGDRIINQHPKPGAVGDANTQLILYLGDSGSDADLVMLPSVRGASIDIARSILESAGFTVKLEVESRAGIAGLDDEFGAVITVFSQIPSGEIRIERGTEIRLRAR
jgi:beta-lactam-binding protein with PASTA domain